jgi:hypothetical protein
MMNRFDHLKNRHQGERAVIVANGPSLNNMDLSFLRHEHVIGMNKIYLGFKKFRFYPRYYVAVNAKVLQQASQEIKALNCVKFISRRAKQFIPENALTYHIETQTPPARFCKDISLGVHEGWTVTYVALQIAYYLGFEEVIIIGMDHRFEYSGQPNESRILKGDDPNHFCHDYFGGGQEWDNPDLQRSEESYQLARIEYEKVGRRIIDATLNGACSVFEKEDYRKVFPSEL